MKGVWEEGLGGLAGGLGEGSGRSTPTHHKNLQKMQKTSRNLGIF